MLNPKSPVYITDRSFLMLGGYGSQCYTANFGKKLQGSDVADPVYLNIPDYLLDDAQVNGEYVAYALKYVSAVSGGRKVGAITLSQGK